MPMNPRLLRPLASGFDPRRIAGLQGWWDASDTAFLFQNSDGTTAATATNDPVGYWRDKSGNGRHALQTTNNDRPLLKLADLNGLPSLDFDGSSDFFRVNSGSQFAAFFVFAVVRRTGTPQSWAAIYKQRQSGNAAGFTNSAGEYNGFQQTSNRTGRLFCSGVSGDTLRQNGVQLTQQNSGVFGIFDAELLNNTTDARVLTGRVSGSTSGTQFPIIGRDPDSTSNRHYPMRLHELLIYSTDLSATEFSRVEKWLGAKWGITVS